MYLTIHKTGCNNSISWGRELNYGRNKRPLVLNRMYFRFIRFSLISCFTWLHRIQVLKWQTNVKDKKTCRAPRWKDALRTTISGGPTSRSVIWPMWRVICPHEPNAYLGWLETPSEKDPLCSNARKLYRPTVQFLHAWFTCIALSNFRSTFFPKSWQGMFHWTSLHYRYADTWGTPQTETLRCQRVPATLHDGVSFVAVRATRNVSKLFLAF